MVNSKYLKGVFNAFRLRVYEGEGASGSEGAAENAAESSVATEGVVATDSSPETTEVAGPALYSGGKERNPDNRPLKYFTENMKKWTEAQINNYIDEYGKEAFMSDDELAEKAIQEKSNDKTDKTKDASEKDKDKNTSDESTKTDEEKEVDSFTEQTGISQEDFNKLPETTQEKIVGLIEQIGVAAEAQKKYDALQLDVITLNEDPIISARLEELSTGKKYVASVLPEATDADIGSLSDLVALGDTAEIKKALNKMIADRATAAVSNERSVHDAKVERKLAEEAVSKTLTKVAATDKRMAVEYDGNWASIPKNHPDYQKVKELLDFCASRYASMKTISSMKPKEIYAAFAASKGWDVERDKNMQSTITKNLLNNLRNPKTAKTLGTGKTKVSAVPSDGNTPFGISNEALVESIAKGDYTAYNKQLDMSDGNPDRLAELRRIRKQGQEKQEQ